MRVLHVSEAMGGGIVSSLLAMVDATPDVDHHVLARPRAGHDTGDEWPTRFTSAHQLPVNPFRAVRRLRLLTRQLYPDVVHAHSSFAGAVVRAAGLDRQRIVYSPHCFAFERRDIGGLERRAFQAVERVLAPRTDLFVAVSPYEIDLAVELGHREIAYAPNRTLLSPGHRARHAQPARIVTVGRVSPQKDWRYFLHVKRYAEVQLGVDATWEWLGGGDPEGEQALADAGVQVSGWLSRTDLVERMARAQVYLHTAAWEAAPISVLEAAALGLPLAVRAIPPLASLRLPGLATTVSGLAEEVADLVDPDRFAAAQEASVVVARRHTRTIQGERLREAYARVCAGTTSPTVRSVADLDPAGSVLELVGAGERQRVAMPEARASVTGVPS